MDITPPDIGGLVVFDVSFASPSIGWMAVGADPNTYLPSGDPPFTYPITLMVTADGGRTWQALPIEVERGSWGPSFDIFVLDALNGWIVVNRTETMNSSAADLYWTRDGGQTWQKSRLPNNGPVRFISPTVGWAIGSCCTGAPLQLYRTTDGGATWRQQVVAPDPIDDSFDYNDYALPVFLDESQGILPITLRGSSSETTGLAFYETSDAGQTWTLAATAPPNEAFANYGSGISIPTSIVSREVWFVSAGRLSVTRNSGADWETITPAGFSDYFLERIQFATDTSGWALASRTRSDFTSERGLFASDDGGQTWTPLYVQD
jgi:photosystem II stability/assembly factor-like uncharacterized protein